MTPTPNSPPGSASAWRSIREAVDLLAATAPDLTAAMRRIRRLAFVILDGTLIAIDRLRGHKDRPHYSGKHKRHGVNVQVIADPHGRLVWLSPALPGATHDLTAARAHGIIAALTAAAVVTLADKAYRGAGGAIAVPLFGRDLPTRIRDCNSSHNQTRGIGERANATLKTWRRLHWLRCCPQQATALTAAILVLQQVEDQHGLGCSSSIWHTCLICAWTACANAAVATGKGSLSPAQGWAAATRNSRWSSAAASAGSA